MEFCRNNLLSWDCRGVCGVKSFAYGLVIRCLDLKDAKIWSGTDALMLWFRWTWKLLGFSNRTLRKTGPWTTCACSWIWPTIQRKLLVLAGKRLRRANKLEARASLLPCQVSFWLTFCSSVELAMLVLQSVHVADFSEGFNAYNFKLLLCCLKLPVINRPCCSVSALNALSHLV